MKKIITLALIAALLYSQLIITGCAKDTIEVTVVDSSKQSSTTPTTTTNLKVPSWLVGKWYSIEKDGSKIYRCELSADNHWLLNADGSRAEGVGIKEAIDGFRSGGTNPIIYQGIDSSWFYYEIHFAPTYKREAFFYKKPGGKMATSNGGTGISGNPIEPHYRKD